MGSDEELPSDIEEAVPVCELVTVASVAAEQWGEDESTSLGLDGDLLCDHVEAELVVELLLVGRSPESQGRVSRLRAKVPGFWLGSKPRRGRCTVRP